MSRTLTYVTIPVIALFIGGAVQVFRPLPPVQAQTTTSQVILPGALSMAFPTRGQAAIGEESLGVVAETPNQQPAAIASLTKMMTAYLLLQAQPLKVGEDGPVTTITAADVAEYEKDKASGYSVAKVGVGEKLTERQLLQALLLPSADNIATLIARQVSGSEEKFIAKMNETAHALGMTQTTYADVSGVNPATVSTAHDQILLAQAVIKDRTIRDIVAMPQADLPTAGRVFNVNFMVGKQGISGIKTGSTLAAGSCFVGSYPVMINGTQRTVLCALLGQQSLRVAITTNAALMHAAAPQFKDYPLPAPANGIAQLTTPWKQEATLTPAQPLQVFGFPGMTVNLAAKVTQANLPIKQGQEVAALTITTGHASKSFALTSAQAIEQPNFLWRLHR